MGDVGYVWDMCGLLWDMCGICVGYGRIVRLFSTGIYVKMKRKLILIAWMIGILFPFGWLTRYSDVYRRAFDALFGPPWVHVLVHVAIYAVLAYLLAGLVLMRRPLGIRPRYLGLLLAVILAVAVGQEGFQLWFKGRLLGASEWFDVAVDLAGALLGLAVFALLIRRGELRNL